VTPRGRERESESWRGRERCSWRGRERERHERQLVTAKLRVTESHRVVVVWEEENRFSLSLPPSLPPSFPPSLLQEVGGHACRERGSCVQRERAT
jgi:hypothetical protein